MLPSPFSGERRVFSTNGGKTTGHSYVEKRKRKNKPNSYIGYKNHTKYKNHLKMDHKIL